jgi:hypothetical protein
MVFGVGGLRVVPCWRALYYEFINSCDYLSIYVLCGEGELGYRILTPNYAFVTFNPARTAAYTLDYGHEWYLKSEAKVYLIEYTTLRQGVSEFHSYKTDIVHTLLFMEQVLSYFRNYDLKRPPKHGQSISPPPTSFIL